MRNVIQAVIVALLLGLSFPAAAQDSNLESAGQLAIAEAPDAAAPPLSQASADAMAPAVSQSEDEAQNAPEEDAGDTVASTMELFFNLLAALGGCVVGC